jgi:hypothetical protein
MSAPTGRRPQANGRRPARRRAAGAPVDGPAAEAAPRPAPPAEAADAAAARPEPPADAAAVPTPAPRAGPAPEGGESPLRSALSVLTTLGPPLTIATALMVYFGWARSNMQARVMGLDVSLFGFSTQDYVLQSISTLYVPLLAAAALALGCLALHQRVGAALARQRARPMLRTAGRAALGLGLLAAAAAVLAANAYRNRGPLVLPLVIPLVLAAGTAVATYGGWLARAATGPQALGRAGPPWQRALRALLVGVVITLSLFWETSNYAGVVGRGQALEIARTLSQRPRATVYSATPLGIQAPGVREQRLAPGPGAGKDAPRWRTTGLRFMTRSGGRMFLLHDGWTPRRGTVIVLPDDEQLRWQFSR